MHPSRPQFCDNSEAITVCSSCLAKNPEALRPRWQAGAGSADGSSGGKPAVPGSAQSPARGPCTDAKRQRLEGCTASAAPVAAAGRPAKCSDVAVQACVAVPPCTERGVQAVRANKRRNAAVQAGPSRLLALSQAVLASSNKWEAVAAVATALGQLEASGQSAAAWQQQLDAALFSAVHNGSPAACTAVMEMLLHAGASAAAVNSSGCSLLVYFLQHMPAAVWSEQQTANLVQVLVKAGADATASAAGDMSPLQAAVRLQGAPAVRGAIAALIAAGADVHQTDGLQRTLLHQAAAHCTSQEGLAAGIRALLAAGCDALAVDADGRLAYQLLDCNPAHPLEDAADLLMHGMAARAVADREAAAELKAQHDALQTCVVCLQRPRTTALMPCGHFAFCGACAAGFASCPICRRLVDGDVPVHLS